MSAPSLHTAALKDWLERLRAGDPAAPQELLQHTQQRLERLARKMLQRYPSVHRWVETADVLQNASLRLLRSLERVPVDSVPGFFGLAATELRRELIDLARHFYGKLGAGANHASGSAPDVPAPNQEPGSLDQWCAFHEQVDLLPDEQREAVHLLFYQGLAQAEAAQLLNISLRTLQRRWQAALLALHESLHRPGEGHV
ncbi:MAG: RNA polymerase sigma factor [Gemmataceae bacterium]